MICGTQLFLLRGVSQSLKLTCYIFCLFDCVFYLVHMSPIHWDVTTDRDHNLLVELYVFIFWLFSVSMFGIVCYFWKSEKVLY